MARELKGGEEISAKENCTVEYHGEILPITWNDYINLMWLSEPGVLIVKVPERPNKEKEEVK